jgi:hypothetical protein
MVPHRTRIHQYDHVALRRAHGLCDLVEDVRLGVGVVGRVGGGERGEERRAGGFVVDDVGGEGEVDGFGLGEREWVT